ncbi:MAG TPA: mismatch-specific DNA-glycosylase [Byssovorax sp.]
MKGLRDVIAPDLGLLFVGINPGLRSAEIGHHFAGKTNPFWRLLHAAELTPVLLAPEDDGRLVEFGLGVTNLCPRPSRAADELTKDERDAGAAALHRKVKRFAPRAVALVGVGLYKPVFPKGTAPGPGAKPERIGGAPVFVVPNPSGLNASFPGFAHKLVWFEALRGWLSRPRAD